MESGTATWTRFRERLADFNHLPANRYWPSTRTVIISAAALLLVTLAVAAIVVGSSSSRSSSPNSNVYQVSIHPEISKWTGGHGNDYWQYCGFKANRSLTIVHLGVCGPTEDAHYKVRLKLAEEYEYADPNLEPMALGETESRAFAQAGQVYLVHFGEPVQIKANTWYRAYVHISEGPPNTYYGIRGRDSEDVACGQSCAVNFRFSFNDGQPCSIGFQV